MLLNLWWSVGWFGWTITSEATRLPGINCSITSAIFTNRLCIHTYWKRFANPRAKLNNCPHLTKVTDTGCSCDDVALCDDGGSTSRHHRHAWHPWRLEKADINEKSALTARLMSYYCNESKLDKQIIDHRLACLKYFWMFWRLWNGAELCSLKKMIR